MEPFSTVDILPACLCSMWLLTRIENFSQLVRVWYLLHISGEGSDRPVQRLSHISASMHKEGTQMKGQAKIRALVPLDSWACILKNDLR